MWLPGLNTGFVLDGLSAFPAVAFSVRQLTANPLYARPYCMLVRRSSDNTTLNIGYVNGLLDVITLLAFVGSGNGYVVTWYNQGSLGSSGDATQSTAASQPQIVASGVVETQNGVPSVYFGGSQSLKSINPIGQTGSNPSTFTAIASFSNFTNGPYLLSFGSSSSLHARDFYALVSGLSGMGIYGSDISGGTITANMLFIQTGIFNTSAQNLFNNGVQVAIGAYSGMNTAASPIFIATNTAGAQFLTGFESEAMIFYAVQSANDKAVLDLNQAAFFSIAGVTQ